MQSHLEHPHSIEMPSAPPLTAPRTLDSRKLFDGEQEIRIVHEGQEYRLRTTRNSKLILTK